jgi:hypothetical protein
MATLKDASVLTDELARRIRRLDEEVSGGSTDLVQLSVLADSVAELADSLAGTFAAVDEKLTRGLAASKGTRGGGAQRQQRRRSGSRDAARVKKPYAPEEPSKSKLL